MDSPIQVSYIDHLGMFDSFSDLKTLRIHHKIISYPIGTLKQKSRQNLVLGTPFILDKYSLTYLYSQKTIEINNKTPKIQAFLSAISESFAYKVYENLKKQGVFVVNGEKFGADFMIYDDDPELVHAKALIFLSEERGITELNRLSTIVKKDGYFAHYSFQNPLTILYTKISRIKPQK